MLPVFAWFAWFAVHLNCRFAVQSFARLLGQWRAFWRAGIQIATRDNLRFQKYRVAPRLGTNTVRQRLLLGLHTRAALAATETGMA